MTREDYVFRKEMQFIWMRCPGLVTLFRSFGQLLQLETTQMPWASGLKGLNSPKDCIPSRILRQKP